MSLFSSIRFSRNTIPAVSESPLPDQAESLKQLLMNWILANEANQRWLINHFPLLESDVEYQRVLTFDDVVAIVDKYQAQRSSRSLSQRALSWLNRSTTRFEQLHAVIGLHRELRGAFPIPSTSSPSVLPVSTINTEARESRRLVISRSLKDRLREAISVLPWQSSLYKQIKIFQYEARRAGTGQNVHVTQASSQAIGSAPSGSPNHRTPYLPNGAPFSTNQSLYQATCRVLENGMQALNIYGAYKQSRQDLTESERLAIYVGNRDINTIWRELIINRYLPSSNQSLRPAPWSGCSDATERLNHQGPRLLLHMGRLQVALQTFCSQLNAQPVSEAEISRTAKALALILWEGVFLSPHIISHLWDTHHKLVKDLQQLIQQYPNRGALEELHQILQALTTNVIVSKSSQGMWPVRTQVYRIFINVSSDDWRILHNKLMQQLQQYYVDAIDAYRKRLRLHAHNGPEREALNSLDQYARYVIKTMMFAETKAEAEWSRQAFEAVNTQLAAWQASLSSTPSHSEEGYTLPDGSTPAGKLIQSLRRTNPGLFAGMDCRGRVSSEDFQQIRNIFTKRYHPDRPPTSELAATPALYTEAVKAAIVFFKEGKELIESRARDRALKLARQSLKETEDESTKVHRENMQAMDEKGVAQDEAWSAAREARPTIDKAVRLYGEVSSVRQKAAGACGITPVLARIEQVCLEVEYICKEANARRQMVTQQVKDAEIRYRAIRTQREEIRIRAASAKQLCLHVDNQIPGGIHLYQDAIQLKREDVQMGRDQVHAIYEQAHAFREEAQAYRDEALVGQRAICLYQQAIAICQVVQQGQTDVQVQTRLKQIEEEMSKFLSQMIHESTSVVAVATEVPLLSGVLTTLFATSSSPEPLITSSSSSSMYSLD